MKNVPLFTGCPLGVNKCQLSSHSHHHLVRWHQGLEVPQDALQCPALWQHLCSWWQNHQSLLNSSRSTSAKDFVISSFTIWPSPEKTSVQPWHDSQCGQGERQHSPALAWRILPPPLGGGDFVTDTKTHFAGLQPHVDIAAKTTAQRLFSWCLETACGFRAFADELPSSWSHWEGYAYYFQLLSCTEGKSKYFPQGNWL